jgi:hypothetical protein
MTKEEAKLAHALVSFYVSLYKFTYDREPRINRHREKWAMQDVIDSVGYDKSKELLQYYFKIKKPGHPLTWFFYNFDKLEEVMEKTQKDKERRAFLLEQTKRMVEENEQ